MPSCHTGAKIRVCLLNQGQEARSWRLQHFIFLLCLGAVTELWAFPDNNAANRPHGPKKGRQLLEPQKRLDWLAQQRAKLARRRYLISLKGWLEQTFFARTNIRKSKNNKKRRCKCSEFKMHEEVLFQAASSLAGRRLYKNDAS